MLHPEIILILARAKNGVIGNDGGLPWHIPADMRHFKQLTKGRPMIMGRKTFDSLPGLLPGRRHIVLTRDTEWEEDGAEPVHSIESALKTANSAHVSVIGGAEIYRMFLHLADRIELTEVDAEPAGDTVMEDFDPDIFVETARQSFPAAGRIPAHHFVTLVRRAPK